MERIHRSKIISFDAEASGLDQFSDDYKVAGLCFAFDQHEGFYLPIYHETPDSAFNKGLFRGSKEKSFSLFPPEIVRSNLESSGFHTKALIGHNIKYDFHVLRRLGMAIPTGPVLDTFLASKVDLPYRSNGLKARIQEIFGYDPEKLGDVASEDKDFTRTDPRRSYTYAAADAVNTLRLAAYMAAHDDKDVFRVCESVEFPLIAKIAEIEAFGVCLDTPELEEFSTRVLPELDKLEKVLRKRLGVDFNPGSTAEKFNAVYRFMRCPFPEGKEPDRGGGAKEETLEAVQGMCLDLAGKLDKLRQRIPAFIAGERGLLNYLEAVYDVLKDARIEHTRLQAYENASTEYMNYLSERMESASKELRDKEQNLRLMMAWSKLSKLETAFVEKLPKLVQSDNRIHGQFLQIKNSGRQGMSDPNLQQLPRTDTYEVEYPEGTISIDADIRRCILPPPGYVYVCADWDAMEMKMVAAVSQCPVLLSVVEGLDEDGEPFDAHLKTVELMGLFQGSYMDLKRIYKNDKDESYPQLSALRQDVKPINFGLVYGITKYGLAVQINKSPDEAEILMGKYFQTYYGVKRWLDTIYDIAERTGFVSTDLGRRREIPQEAYEDPNLLKHYVRACGNHLIQGGCADIAKYAESQTCNALRGHDAHFANFIHDEFIVAARDEPETVSYTAAALMHCMTKKYKGVTFTATPEVKRNLAKSPRVEDKGLIDRYPAYGSPELRLAVAQSLGLTEEQLFDLPWSGR